MDKLVPILVEFIPTSLLRKKILCDMDSFHKFIKAFPHYTPSVFEEVRPFLFRKTIAIGDYFLRTGNSCNQVGFIETGMLRLVYLRDGKEVTQCFCKENSITTSYRGLITQQKSDIAIQAVEPSELIVLSYDALQRLYAKSLFWQQVGRLAAENELLMLDEHTRFINDFSATERYLHILHHQEFLLHRVPLNYLASYLQISPETLSRIRKKITRT